MHARMLSVVHANTAKGNVQSPKSTMQSADEDHCPQPRESLNHACDHPGPSSLDQEQAPCMHDSDNLISLQQLETQPGLS